ncbi:MAG: hypothetical protein V3T02_02145 [Alphaproteobacteria bacterium]
MDAASPRERFGPTECSDELGAIFDAIAQATVDDAPKFTPDISRRLARDIICRTYAGAIYELCHLTHIADQVFGTQGFEDLFWGHGPARAAEFREQFETAMSGSGRCQNLAIDKNGIRIGYPDGEFTTTFGRMAYLSAVIEFLVSAIGYAELDDALRGENTQPVTMASLSHAASAITREVYGFLKPHLASVHAQRKFRFLMSFLKIRNGDGVGPEDLDDEAVLDFWIFASTSAETNVDFRTFKTVFVSFIDMRDALAAARDRAAMKAAMPLGPDRENGEIDPAEVETALVHIEARRAPFDQLRTPPASAVKFLNKRETAAIEMIVEGGEAALAMPLSVMRSQVFGAIQARITQSLRNRAVSPPSAQTPVANHGIPSYRDYAQRIDDTKSHLEQVLLASFHILASERHSQAITVFLGLAPEIDLRPLAPLFRDDQSEDGNVITLTGAAVGDCFLANLAAHPDRHPTLAAFLADAKTAVQRIARKGFRQSADNRNRIEGFAVAIDALFAIRKQIDRFCDRLKWAGIEGEGRDRQHRKDHKLFFAQFRILYGDFQ